MATSVTFEYDQVFSPAVVRVTRKFQDMQNLINSRSVKEVCINTLIEDRRLFEAWAANFDRLWGHGSRSRGSRPGELNELARGPIHDAKGKVERLELTLSNEIAALRHCLVAIHPHRPGAANQYETMIGIAIRNIETSIEYLIGTSVVQARDGNTEYSRARSLQQIRYRQMNA